MRFSNEKISWSISLKTVIRCFVTLLTDFKGLHFLENPKEWWLLTNSSQISLIPVLLSNDDKYPSVPLAPAIKLKEHRINMWLLLEKKLFLQYSTNICVDLKCTTSLTGLQGGYTKFCRFLCEWHNRVKDTHCVLNIFSWRASSTLMRNFETTKYYGARWIFQMFLLLWVFDW